MRPTAAALSAWLAAARRYVAALPPGPERDLTLAEFALREVVLARWRDLPADPVPDGAGHAAAGRPGTAGRAGDHRMVAGRADWLAWPHLAGGRHDPAGECAALVGALRGRHAVDVVASDPHRRYTSGYLLDRLAAAGCPAARRVPAAALSGWPGGWHPTTPAAAYELTHAVYWLTDFGMFGWSAGARVLDAAAARVAAAVAAATDRFVPGPDLDLALELVLAGLLLGTGRTAGADQVPTDLPLPELAAVPAGALRAVVHPRLVLDLLNAARHRSG